MALRKGKTVLLALGLSVLTTFAGLCLLAWLMFRMSLGERAIYGGILGLYLVSNLLGGWILGRCMLKKRYLWGLMLGTIYSLVLFLLGLAVERTDGFGVVNGLLTIGIIIGSSMLGAMLAGNG